MERAVYNDCRALIDNFAQNGNPRFESFCVQWKTMVFQHMYSAQSTTIELLQTTAAALHAAKRIACGRRIDGSTRTGEAGGGDEQTQLLRRIGGIYLMYALYFKQPTEEYVKVTMSLEAWRELSSFIHELPNIAATDEVRYVFWKLRQTHAFRFAALDFCVGLDQLVDYDTIEEQSSKGTTTSEERASLEKAANLRLRQELHELGATQELVPALTVLEDGYNEMKEMLVSTSGGGSSDLNAQSLPPTTIFRDLKQAFQNIQQILDEPRKVAAELASGDSKKRRLKQRSYKITHTDTDLKGDAGDSKVSVVGQLRAMRRMSARTVFTEQLPADMLRDLQQSEGEQDLADEEEMGEDEVAEDVAEDPDVRGVAAASLMEIEEMLLDNCKSEP